ncbi:GGDEF domain-containing protein, partial [Azotobacter chroococcum]|nr:GGDEF domain-containing protein [Azotobacter chroococcum]
VFRMGGEEFLVLLVDVNQGQALGVAEKLRQQAEQERFRLPSERDLQLTVSIGLALHDGHPDYQRQLRQADRALYEAKHGGRNRVMLARELPG